MYINSILRPTSTNTKPANDDVWQDIADSEEFNAWSCEATSNIESDTEDASEFGDWVDSSDLKPSVHVSDDLPLLDNCTPGLQASAITRGAIIARNSDAAKFSLDLLNVRISFNDRLETNSLDSNPWTDVESFEPTFASRDDQHDNNEDYDPEIDSAMAFSEWENDRTTSAAHEDDSHVDDDEDAMYDAWDMEQEGTVSPHTSADEVVDHTSYSSDNNAFVGEPGDRFEERDRSSLHPPNEKRARHRNRQSLQLRWMRRLTDNMPT